MEQAEEIIENSVEENFDSLSDQLKQKQEENNAAKTEDPPEGEEIPEKAAEKEQPKREKPRPASKKFTFRRGEEAIDVDEDFEFEMMADKKPIKLTLREMKERSAGDIAVKNRMHSLAEERKQVQATFKEFSKIAKDDPLGALEYISGKINETDSEFEYQSYLNKLGEQATKLGEMSAEERKAWELEKKLNKANKDLSQKDRENAVARKKQEVLERFPEIGDRKFGEMVEAVMGSEALMQDCENEGDVLDKAEKLIEETFLQVDIAELISEVDPNMANDNELIFAIRDQVIQNPDFDDDDVRDIIKEVLGPARRKRVAKTLSQKQRASGSLEEQQTEGGSNFDLLKAELEKRNQKK